MVKVKLVQKNEPKLPLFITISSATTYYPLRIGEITYALSYDESKAISFSSEKLAEPIIKVFTLMYPHIIRSR